MPPEFELTHATSVRPPFCHGMIEDRFSSISAWLHPKAVQQGMICTSYAVPTLVTTHVVMLGSICGICGCLIHEILKFAAPNILSSFSPPALGTCSSTMTSASPTLRQDRSGLEMSISCDAICDKERLNALGRVEDCEVGGGAAFGRPDGGWRYRSWHFRLHPKHALCWQPIA